MTVIMERCPKIEYGRLCGENAWAGINSGVIDSRRPAGTVAYQRFRLPASGWPMALSISPRYTLV